MDTTGYEERRQNLAKEIEQRKLSKAAVARLAGMTAPWEYIFALRVINGDQIARPTLKRLEKAMAKL